MLVQYNFLNSILISIILFLLFVIFGTFEHILYSENQSSDVANHLLKAHYIFITVSKYKGDLEIVVPIHIFSNCVLKCR